MRSVRPARLSPLALVLAVGLAVAASGPAAADDAPKPPPPAPPAGNDAPAPGGAADGKTPDKPAERVRKADPKAVELVGAYTAKLDIPANSKCDSVAASAEIGLRQLGPDPVTMKPSWSRKSGLACEVALPESIVESLGPEMAEMIKGPVKNQLVDQLLRPLYEGPAAGMERYDLHYREEAEKRIVKAMPIREDTPWERVEMTFDKDGLLTGLNGTPRVDPNDPMAAMLAGTEVEFTIRHGKRGEKGEKLFVSGADVTMPTGEVTVTTHWWDGPDGMALLRRVDVKMSEGMSSALHVWDYVVDGKPVEATKRPAKEDAPKPSPTPTPVPTPTTPDAPK